MTYALGYNNALWRCLYNKVCEDWQVSTISLSLHQFTSIILLHLILFLLLLSHFMLLRDDVFLYMTGRLCY